MRGDLIDGNVWAGDSAGHIGSIASLPSSASVLRAKRRYSSLKGEGAKSLLAIATVLHPGSICLGGTS